MAESFGGNLSGNLKGRGAAPTPARPPEHCCKKKGHREMCGKLFPSCKISVEVPQDTIIISYVNGW